MTRRNMFLHFFLFHYILVWKICANTDQVLFNRGLVKHQCMTDMIGFSYTQCLSHFRSNHTKANVMVYKRRFSLCCTFIFAGTLVHNVEPGSILAYRTMRGKFDF